MRMEKIFLQEIINYVLNCVGGSAIIAKDFLIANLASIITWSGVAFSVASMFYLCVVVRRRG